MKADVVEHLVRAEVFEEVRESGAVDLMSMPVWQRGCVKLTNSTRFGNFIIGLIVFNGLLLGLGTFREVRDAVGTQLADADHILLGIFTAEIIIRLAAVRFRLDKFFGRPWNVFDFVAIGASYLPGFGGNATALRLIRLLRVARLLSVLPDVAVLLDGVKRAIRPVTGILMLTLLVMYLYGIVGWSLFAEADPEHWGNIGSSYLTLFQLLTHDHWTEILHNVRDASPYAVLYVVSFILIAAFIIVQLLIGVVLTSLGQAREAHDERELAVARQARGASDSDMTAALDALKAALVELELRAGTGVH